MKKILAAIGLAILLAPTAWAATEIELGEGLVEERPIEPVIEAPEALPAGQLAVFSAEKSYVPEGVSVRYEWTFDGKKVAVGRQVSHAFDEAGEHEVKLRIRAAGGETAETELQTFVYKSAASLITYAASDSRLEALREDATRSLTRIEEVTLTGGADLALRRARSQLQISSDLALWGGAELLGAFLDFGQREEMGLDGKTILVFTDENYAGLRPIAWVLLSVLRPDQVILARPGDAFTWLEVGSADLATTLSRRGRDFILLTPEDLRPRPWNVASIGINRLISAGIPRESLELFLMLPFLAVLVVFLKQVIGMKTGGVALPLLLILVIIPLGLPLGLTAICLAFLGTMLADVVTKRLPRMMAVPLLAFRVIVPATLALALMIAASYAGMTWPPEAMISLFILLLLAEKFADLQREPSALGILGNVAQILGVVLIGWMLWEMLPAARGILLVHPELVLAGFGLNYMLGRYTGLRLTEQWRYRELARMREGEEE